MLTQKQTQPTEAEYYAGLTQKQLNNCARTKQDLFDSLNEEFGFTLDGAASKWDAKCERFNSQTAATHKWAEGERVWCNPPWTWTRAWVEYALVAAYVGCLSVMLVPAGLNSRWFSEHGWRAQVRLFERRPEFNPPPGLSYDTRARADAMLLIFDPENLTQSRSKLNVCVCDSLGRPLT